MHDVVHKGGTETKPSGEAMPPSTSLDAPHAPSNRPMHPMLILSIQKKTRMPQHSFKHMHVSLVYILYLPFTSSHATVSCLNYSYFFAFIIWGVRKKGKKLKVFLSFSFVVHENGI